jgi:RNA polymerase sigma-70 factor (ECF subfamily)
VISPNARGVWQEIDGQLRPFVARRLADQNDLGDVMQDIYVRIQAGLPRLRDAERFGPWVYQVARSALADYARASQRHPKRADEDEAMELADPLPAEADGEAERELATHLAVFVAALPSPYREAITLTELQGMTQKDAAEVLGISLSGMKSRVQRGRQQIQQMLLDCCEIGIDARGRVMSYERRGGSVVPENCCDDTKSCKC